MNNRKKLAYIHYALAAFVLIFVIGFAVIMSLADNEEMSYAFYAFIICIAFGLSLPHFYVAHVVSENKSYSITVAAIVSALHFLNFPLGTFIGAYCIYLCWEINKEDKLAMVRDEIK